MLLGHEQTKVAPEFKSFALVTGGDWKAKWTGGETLKNMSSAIGSGGDALSDATSMANFEAITSEKAGLDMTVPQASRSVVQLI